MSSRPAVHRTSVKKKNRRGSRMWWAECTCGWYQGWHEKGAAQSSIAEHVAKVVP